MSLLSCNKVIFMRGVFFLISDLVFPSSSFAALQPPGAADGPPEVQTPLHRRPGEVENQKDLHNPNNLKTVFFKK